MAIRKRLSLTNGWLSGLGDSCASKLLNSTAAATVLSSLKRAAQQEWRAQQKERLLSELQEGTITKGAVTSIRPFGVFVDVGGADGLVQPLRASLGP